MRDWNGSCVKDLVQKEICLKIVLKNAGQEGPDECTDCYTRNCAKWMALDSLGGRSVD